MTVEYIIVLAVIAVLSVVQSLFGMGVLVFGTPTLLLMGYDFITTLSYLLPASFAISLLQVQAAGENRVPISKYLYLLCLPGIGIGLWFADAPVLASWTNTLIGGVLLFSALIRLWKPARLLLLTLLEKYLPIYHLMIGLTHGLTNLGGGLLAILASGLNSDKDLIRNTIAHYYLAFSIIQMITLVAVLGYLDILIAHSPTGIVSAAVYLLIGNRLFFRTSNPTYNMSLTLFMAIYGIVILLEN